MDERLDGWMGGWRMDEWTGGRVNGFGVPILELLVLDIKRQ